MKTKIHKTITTTLSLFLVLAVFLTATHAKDLVTGAQPSKAKSRAVEGQIARAVDEPVQKAISELHNHAEKTMLKNFAKQMSADTPMLAAKRSEKNEHNIEDQPLSLRILEAVFMVQLAVAYTASSQA